MKIIVSDFDGTLFSDAFEANLEAINSFVAAGNKFIIATGRAMNSLSEDLSLVELDCEYYICNDGAVIFDRYFNVVYRKDIRGEIVRPIFNILQDDKNTLEVFVDTSHGFVADPNKAANGIRARFLDKTQAMITLDSIMRQYPEVHGYISTNWVNIIDHKINKATAIDFLVESYKYDSNEIITVGDGINDYEMIKNYNGFTLINGHEDLKTISNGIVKDLSELVDMLDRDAKAKEYEEIFLNED